MAHLSYQQVKKHYISLKKEKHTRNANYKTAGLSCFRQSFQNKGLPEDITEILLQSWRDGTRQSYDSKITLWTTFCDEWKIDYMQPSVTEVLKFLHSLKSKGFIYSIINSARSALSVFITPEGLKAGKDPLICQYMKGLYNINPSLLKYSFTWDVGIVVKHLSGIPNNLTGVTRQTSYIISNFMWSKS